MNSKEAKKLCLDLLKVTKGTEVKEILKKNSLWENKSCWREYGDDSQSWSIVGGQGDANFSLNEKIFQSCLFPYNQNLNLKGQVVLHMYHMHIFFY